MLLVTVTIKTTNGYTENGEGALRIINRIRNLEVGGFQSNLFQRI